MDYVTSPGIDTVMQPKSIFPIMESRPNFHMERFNIKEIDQTEYSVEKPSHNNDISIVDDVSQTLAVKKTD